MQSKQHLARIGDGAGAGVDATGANLTIVTLQLMSGQATSPGDPLQSRQPEIVSAVHERLITLAKARRILANPGLVHYDMTVFIRFRGPAYR